MFSPVVLVLLVVVLGAAPVLGAVGARRSGRGGLDLWASAAAAVAAIVLVVHVHQDGPVRLAGGASGVDRVGAAWALFVVLTGVAVRTFARRQLAAEPLRERFHLRSALVVAAAALLCLAGDLWALVAASAATSVAAAALVGMRSTAASVSTMRTTLLVGDALLLFAVVVTAVSTGSASTAALAELDGAARDLVALSVVLAALVKCAQPPVHGWLPRTLVAPTPASALLHAGVINAGGVLLVRFAPVIGRSAVATVVGLVLAGAGAVIGTAVMRARADVKGELVWSTVAQMGFMLVQVLVGLAPAAAAHLIAHGAYKSSCFLTSGSGLEHRPARPRAARAHHHVLAAVLSVGIVAGAVAVTGFDLSKHEGAQVLVPLFAAFTVWSVLAGPAGLRRGATRGVAGLVLAVAAATTAYLAGIARFESWLGLPDHTPDGAFAMVLLFTGAVALAAVAVAAVERRPTPITGGATGPLQTALLAVRARRVAASRRPVLDTVISGGH